MDFGTFLYKWINARIYRFCGFGFFIFDGKIKILTPFNFRHEFYTDEKCVSYYRHCNEIEIVDSQGRKCFGTIAVPVDKPGRRVLNVSRFVTKGR